MKTAQNLGPYLTAIVQEGLYPSTGNLQFHLDCLFSGVDFTNKRVLDIGGGSGIYSFYAAYKGAKEVICIDPEGDGSLSGIKERFSRLKTRLSLNNVNFDPVTFQSYDAQGELFDIILLHNSINHLDEQACISLLESDQAKASYQEIFAKVNSISNKGATLIVCDCSRKNFFALLKLRNPFAPTIEWHKHQAPEVWASLLSSVGFVNPKIKWSSFNRLRSLGRKIAGNKFVAYFLMSHFSLTMEKR